MRAHRSLHAHRRIYPSLSTHIRAPPGPWRSAWLPPTGGDRRRAAGREGEVSHRLKKSPRENPPQPRRFFVVAVLFRTEVGSQTRVPPGETAGTKASQQVTGFKWRPRSGSRGTGGGATGAELPRGLPASPGRTQVGPEGPRAGAPGAGELCLFSSYSWLPSTRLFVAAKGTSGRAGALGGGVGVPLPGPHEFYGIGARRAKLQAESKCVNYRFVL